MTLRVGDIEARFMLALYSATFPLELGEIADWINANKPTERGPVKNDGTLGRTRDKLEESGMIERDATGRRYKATANAKRPVSRLVDINCAITEETHSKMKEIAEKHGKELRDLMTEGVGLVLKAYGRKQAA